MARGGRVDDHHLFLRLFHHIGKGPEHGDLLGAGGTQVLLDVIQILVADAIFHRLADDLRLVPVQLLRLVDVAHRHIGVIHLPGVDVPRRIRGGQVDLLSSGRQAPGDGSGHAGLADAALAHGEDDLLPRFLEIPDQIPQSLEGRGWRRGPLTREIVLLEHPPDVGHGAHVIGAQGDGISF